MASFSSATRELVLKIVYYGPGLGGKTTTLKALHGAVRAEHRGKMVSLATPVDRTLYFDFLPVRLPSVGELQLRLQLFTVPGQVYFNATRKLVLTGADGIVFVADAQVVRLDANTESLQNLRDNLQELGRPMEKTPVVLAYNKRDLPDVMSPEELDRELNPAGFPSMSTSATTGEGIFECLDAVVRLALDDLRERRIIPADVEIPNGGLVSARLSEVRAPQPAELEPTRIVAEEAPRGGVLPVRRSVSQPDLSPGALATAVLSGLPGAGAPAAQAPSQTPAPPAPAPPAVLPPAVLRRGSVFVPLFDPEDQEQVRLIEESLEGGAYARGAVQVETLLARLFERAARMLGRADAPLEGVAWALGIPAERWTRTRATAQRARRGAEVSRRDVLEMYLVAGLVQVALDPLGRA